MVDDGGDVTLLIHKGYELEKTGPAWVNSASGSTEEQIIKNLLKEINKETPNRWEGVVKDWKGVSEETTTGVPPPVRDAEGRQAAGAGPSTSMTR